MSKGKEKENGKEDDNGKDKEKEKEKDKGKNKGKEKEKGAVEHVYGRGSDDMDDLGIEKKQAAMLPALEPLAGTVRELQEVDKAGADAARDALEKMSKKAGIPDDILEKIIRGEHTHWGASFSPRGHTTPLRQARQREEEEQQQAEGAPA
eukprot:gene44301-48752_t